MPPESRPATTVLLLHPEAQGFKVFMVQRHRRSGFLPNAWVFPGGRVDAADHIAGSTRIRGGAAAVSQMIGLDESEAIAYLVAGVRETFEESGIWLGSGDLPDDLRAPLNLGEVLLHEVLERHDAVIDLDLLGSWSWWVTPEAEPKRYDTRFVVARADSMTGRHDETETVNSGWFDPRQVLADATLQSFPMAPPTWWTLKELAEHDTVDEVLAACADRVQLPVQPVLSFSEQGLELRMPGHPEHPDAAIPGMPIEIRFDAGRWAAVFAD